MFITMDSVSNIVCSHRAGATEDAEPNNKVHDVGEEPGEIVNEPSDSDYDLAQKN
mgnify:CR=1 FL=1